MKYISPAQLSTGHINVLSCYAEQTTNIETGTWLNDLCISLTYSYGFRVFSLWVSASLPVFMSSWQQNNRISHLPLVLHFEPFQLFLSVGLLLCGPLHSLSLGLYLFLSLLQLSFALHQLFMSGDKWCKESRQNWEAYYIIKANAFCTNWCDSFWTNTDIQYNEHDIHIMCYIQTRLYSSDTAHTITLMSECLLYLSIQ